MRGSPKTDTAELTTEPLTLHLRHTFTIARASEDIARTLLVQLRFDGVTALGESSPITRYDETVERVARELHRLDLSRADFWAFDELLEALPADEPGARCGLDLVLHDLAGKRLGIPLYQLLGLNPHDAKPTSFTIGIAPLEQTIEKTRAARHMPILKVKLGNGNEVETLEAVRSVYSGTIRLDANEGWSAEQAVKMLGELRRFDIEFCEQPIPAGHPEQLRFVREHSRVPIFVDEDCRRLEDVAPLQGCVDGINIKLVKCGGMRAAIRMIHAARALRMKVMIGCMIESSLLCTAAAHLTPLTDYADVDGPLLITDDPFVGVAYDDGRLHLPSGPGLGVTPRRAP